MISCPKCGGYKISPPQYRQSDDRLHYFCQTCGYESSQPSNDKGKEFNNIAEIRPFVPVK